MMIPLKITAFIENNANWEELLARSPYFVKTKRDGRFVLLKYDQIHSDFTIELVQECRGIILDEAGGYRPVCVPFFKFGNFGEGYVPAIDWSTVRVQEKVDGSLIKLWCHMGEWHISSNGEIDARNAHIHSALITGQRLADLYTLFMQAWENTGIAFDNLDSVFQPDKGKIAPLCGAKSSVAECDDIRQYCRNYPKA